MSFVKAEGNCWVNSAPFSKRVFKIGVHKFWGVAMSDLHGCGVQSLAWGVGCCTSGTFGAFWEWGGEMPHMETHGRQHAEYEGALLFLIPACWVPASEIAVKRLPDT